jgi:hypothetical protein
VEGLRAKTRLATMIFQDDVFILRVHAFHGTSAVPQASTTVGSRRNTTVRGFSDSVSN